MERVTAIAPSTPLDIDITLSSAQTFQWVRIGRGWLGAAGGSVVYLAQKGDHIAVKVYGSNDWDLSTYFRLDDDYTKIIRRISADPLVGRLVKQHPGLRVTRQDPWECLLMFLCSTNNNYKRIVKMVLTLSKTFGAKVDTEFGKASLLPSAKTLSHATLQELVACGLGYRAKYVLQVAKKLREERLDLYSLAAKPYEEAREFLLELPGVGPKVADCVCLFSLGKLQSFPIDTWIRRVVASFYPKVVGKKFARALTDDSKSLGPNTYWAVSQKLRQHFGEFAGYAQNQLYFHAKTLLEKSLGRRPTH